MTSISGFFITKQTYNTEPISSFPESLDDWPGKHFVLEFSNTVGPSYIIFPFFAKAVLIFFKKFLRRCKVENSLIGYPKAFFEKRLKVRSFKGRQVAGGI